MIFPARYEWAASFYLEKISSQRAETSICWRSEDVIQAVWTNNGFFTGLWLRVCQQGLFNSLKFDKTRGRCVSVSVFVCLLNHFSVNVCSAAAPPPCLSTQSSPEFVLPCFQAFFIKMLWLGYLRRLLLLSLWTWFARWHVRPPVCYIWCLHFRERVRPFFTVLGPLLVWSPQRDTFR